MRGDMKERTSGDSGLMSHRNETVVADGDVTHGRRMAMSASAKHTQKRETKGERERTFESDAMPSSIRKSLTDCPYYSKSSIEVSSGNTQREMMPSLIRRRGIEEM